MKVSVIIRTFNRGYVLREALCSVFSQTYSEYEVIVVDDASMDDTAAIVASFGDRIRYIRHEHNRGVGTAFNTGIRAATGELIAALDSDDQWKPEKLAHEVAFLKAHPNIDLVFSNVEIITSTGTIPSLFDLMNRRPPSRVAAGANGCELSRREMYLWLLEEVPVKPSASIVRRKVFEKAGMFDESSRSGEDWEFYLRLSRFSQFGFIEMPLTRQKWSTDATHRKYWEADKSFLLKTFLAERKRIQNDPEATLAVTRGISSHCNDLAYGYLYSGRRTAALNACLRGFKETGEMAFLVRAAAALGPLRVREWVKCMARRVGVSLR